MQQPIYRRRRPSYLLATQPPRQRPDTYQSTMDTLGAAGGTSSVPAISFYPHGDPDEVADVEEASAADGGDGFLRMISSSEQSDGRWRRAAGGTGGLGDSRRSSRCTLRSTLDANHVSAAAAAAAAGASRPLSDASSPPGWTVLFGDRGGGGSHAPSETELHRLSLTEFGADRDADLLEDPAAAAGEDVAAAIAAKLSADSAAVWRRRKNFLALSIGFLLIYTAFRSIQALQSSVNAPGRLGVVAMTCVHACMAAVCPLLAPTIAAGSPPPKWTVVLSAVLYVGWMTANLWPHPLTLLPASLAAGVALTCRPTLALAHHSAVCTAPRSTAARIWRIPTFASGL